MTAYNPTEAARLAALMRRAAGSVIPGGCGVYGDNLRSAADQLEAAGREVERRRRRPPPAGCQCTYEQGDSDCSVHPTCPACGESLCGTSLERDSLRLRQQLEAAQRERDEALTDGVLSQRVCDIENDLAQSRSDLAAAQQRVAALEADLKAAPLPGVALDLKLADKRIAELEAASDIYAKRGDEAYDRERAAKDEHTRDALAWLGKEHTLTMALRAIFPVYRAVVEWARESELVKAGVGGSIDRCFKLEEQVEAWILRARAALTPDILATLKAAGLDAP